MTRRALLPFALLLALGAVPAGAGAAVLPADATVVISGTPDLLGLLATPVGVSRSTHQAISRDGSRVVFASTSDGLVAGDDDDVQNVYVKDLTTGAVQLVSRASDVNGVPGEPSHGDCVDAAISADGHVVAFACDVSLDPAVDTNVLRDVYVRNLDTQQTILVSRAPGGPAGDRASGSPAVAHASSGRIAVAFVSGATNLGGDDPGDGAPRVYRRVLGGGSDQPVLVSRANGASGRATRAGFATEGPSIDDSGNKVAFETTDALEFLNDVNSVSDVYVRDVANGFTDLASISVAGQQPSFGGLISGDGRQVAFTTGNPLDTTLDSGTGNDAYVHTLGSTTTRLVSFNDSGTKANGRSFATAIDTTGEAVAFSSTATNLDPAHDPSPGFDEYLNGFGRTVLVSQRDGADGPGADDVQNQFASGAIDGAGTKVVLDLAEGPRSVNGQSTTVLRDVAASTTRTVSRPPDGVPFVNEGGNASGGSVSADGRYVAFVSDAPGLGVPAGTGRAVLVRDVATGAVTVASREDGPDGALLPDVSFPRISGDGRRVTFTSRSSGPIHVYLRDLPASRTFPVDQVDGGGGAVGTGDSSGATISDDGSRVAFISESNLTPDVPGAGTDAYVHDFATGRTLLVSRASGFGARANGSPDGLAISGDGRSVAFEAGASNLVGDDTNGTSDVFVRTLDATGDGTTVRASLDANGAQGNGFAVFDPSISRDGTRVSFFSNSPSFDTSSPVGKKLYVRDLKAGTLTVAGRADGPDGAVLVDNLLNALLSADGNHIAFTAESSSPNIAPGVPADDTQRVYERDLTTGATRLISRQTGADGAPSGPFTTDVAGLSADGGCVTFEASRRFLPPPASGDYAGVFMRAVTFNCGRPVPFTPPPPSARPAVLSGLSVRPARFWVGGRRGGTRISFRLDRASAVTLAFDRLLPGRKKGRRCLTTVHRGRRCTVVRRAGRVSLAQARLRAGANSVRFSGRIGRRALAPGRYRLTATPLHGRARTVRFVVVRAPRPSR